MVRIPATELSIGILNDFFIGRNEFTNWEYSMMGTPDEHERLILYETDHIPPWAEFIKETLAWLDRYLGPVNNE